jgi:hypothetical protein
MERYQLFNGQEVLHTAGWERSHTIGALFVFYMREEEQADWVHRQHMLDLELEEGFWSPTQQCDYLAKERF